MQLLDLNRLDDPHGRQDLLAADFDSAARGGQLLRLENHGLDTELLDLVLCHGSALLRHPEFSEALVDQRGAMMGVAQRVLRIAGIALRAGQHHFADHHSGAPTAELRVVEPGSTLATAGTTGLLALRQTPGGVVTARVGSQLASLGGRRCWVATRRGSTSNHAHETALVLRFAAPLATFRHVDMPVRPSRCGAPADRAGYEPGQNVISGTVAQAYIQ